MKKGRETRPFFIWQPVSHDYAALEPVLLREAAHHVSE
jgi:hypothetical protein